MNAILVTLLDDLVAGTGIPAERQSRGPKKAHRKGRHSLLQDPDDRLCLGAFCWPRRRGLEVSGLALGQPIRHLPIGQARRPYVAK